LIDTGRRKSQGPGFSGVINACGWPSHVLSAIVPDLAMARINRSQVRRLRTSRVVPLIAKRKMAASVHRSEEHRIDIAATADVAE
jgi:hypothetical protein